MTDDEAPRWQDFFRGAVREALAAVNSVARIGLQETRAWERPLRYVVDDNQGNVAIMEFATTGVSAAVSYRDAKQPVALDPIILAAPSDRRAALRAVCALPLLVSEGVTAIFWSDGDKLRFPEETGRAYLDLFRRELSADAEWLSEGVECYDLVPEVARLCVTIAARSAIGVPIVELSSEELSLLVPEDSKHRTQALDLVFSDALFEAISAREDALRGG